MPKVKFTNNGEEVEVEKNASLKEVIRNEGWPVAFGCEDGLCGTCILNIKKGKENLNQMGEVEQQTLEVMMMNNGDYRLGCQCEVKGDIEIEGF